MFYDRVKCERRKAIRRYSKASNQNRWLLFVIRVVFVFTSQLDVVLCLFLCVEHILEISHRRRDFYEISIINSMHHQNRKRTCDGPMWKHNRVSLKSFSLYGRSIDLISELSWFRHQKSNFRNRCLYVRLTAIKLFSLSSLKEIKWKRNMS